MCMTAAALPDLSLGSVRLPSGGSMPVDGWARRHRGVLAILACHAVGLAAFGLYAGAGVWHSVGEGSVIAFLGLLAAQRRLGRRARSVVAAFGLMSSSAVLVHLSGGYIEAHFHFFVMLGVIFLYEDWLPYVLAVGYVAVHHGVVGTLDPLSVYNHPDALVRPWVWAGIHAVFILGLSAALIVAWNIIERARRSETQALDEAQELKRQLHSQEKMAALGSLVAGLAHEVRTPLTVVGTSAGLLERVAKRDPQNPLAPRVIEEAAEIQAGVERINGLVQQLRRFHALASDELQTVPLDGAVREAMRLFTSANRSARTIHLDLQPTPPASLHLLGIHQVVLNLVTNAVEATDPTTGVVTVRTKADGARAVFMVEDNGVGMDEEAQRRAFDPLFTTKKDGMGLGLHIVKRIVEAHGGTVRFTSREGRGSTFEAAFPLAEPAEPPVAARVEAAVPPLPARS